MRLTNRYIRTLTCLTVLSAAALGTTATLASEGLPPDSLVVRYTQADLLQPTSAAALYKRIQSAARFVCDQPAAHELSRMASYRTCYERAVDNAVARIDATALTALHRNRTQRSATG
jgi:UrcA family protein